MTPEQELSEAICLAAEAHSGQTDKGGKPYILHPLHVMMELKTSDFQLMAIAVMHDLLEDTVYLKRDLLDIGFSSRVVDGVDALTRKEQQTYAEYIDQVLSCPDAVAVKIQDVKHNLDVQRLSKVSSADASRLSKYLKTLGKLYLARGDREDKQ